MLYHLSLEKHELQVHRYLPIELLKQIHSHGLSAVYGFLKNLSLLQDDQCYLHAHLSLKVQFL